MYGYMDVCMLAVSPRETIVLMVGPGTTAACIIVATACSFLEGARPFRESSATKLPAPNLNRLWCP